MGDNEMNELELDIYFKRENPEAMELFANALLKVFSKYDIGEIDKLEFLTESMRCIELLSYTVRSHAQIKASCVSDT